MEGEQNRSASQGTPSDPLSLKFPLVPYASGHSRAKWAIALLAFAIFLTSMDILSESSELKFLHRIKAGEELSEEEINDADIWGIVIGLIQVGIGITALVLFFVWFHRVYRNLPALGAKVLKQTPGWAVGWFFVPIMNLFKPYLAAKEIHLHSDPKDGRSSQEESWKSGSSTTYLGWWWGFWLASEFLSQASLRSYLKADTIEELIAASWVSIVSDGFDIFSSGLTILFIKVIDSHQEEKSLRGLSPSCQD
ncbi:MAG: DUF4328 domain-containing protein [Planctomycetes bacterium]|nr:DUF4328 domain-containing protein [Planctomycetota bacterium]